MEASTIIGWTDDDRLVLALLEKPGAEDWAGLHAAWLAAQLVEATPALGQPMASASPAGLPAPSASTASPAPLATATLSRDASATTPPGSAPASGSASEASQAPAASAGATLHQWAVAATASSQYSETGWSAAQATGPTDTAQFGDQQTAWAPSGRDAGLEWLELTYEQAVIPQEVVIWETSGNGFVTSVELWDGSSWVVAWQGQDQSPQFIVGFSPDLEPVDFATDRVRVTIDTAVDGWNEIDAVALIGTVP
jgi:hypothetical protein